MAQIALDDERKSYASFDAELVQIERKTKDKNKKMAELKINIEQYNVTFDQFKGDINNTRAYLALIEKENKWIEDQKSYTRLSAFLTLRTNSSQTVWQFCSL